MAMTRPTSTPWRGWLGTKLTIWGTTRCRGRRGGPPKLPRTREVKANLWRSLRTTKVEGLACNLARAQVTATLRGLIRRRSSNSNNNN